MADNKVTVEIAVEGNAQVEIKKLENEVKKFEQTTKKSLVDVGRVFDNFIANVASTAAVAAFEALTSAAADLFNFIVTDGVQASIEAEQAVNNLNSSLERAGTFSEEASQSIQNFADAVEASTEVTAEAVLEGVALAQQYVNTAEEAEFLTKTALDFAAAADISFTEAIRRLGRGVQGAAGDIANFAPEIRNLTKEQLAAGEATRLLAERFAGAAAQEANTFQGRLTILSATFGQLTEKIGDAITRNGALNAALTEITKIFSELSSNAGENKEIFNDLVTSAVQLTITLTEGVLVAVQDITLSFLKASQAFQVFQVGVSATAAAFGSAEAGKRAEESAEKFRELGNQIRRLEEGNPVIEKLRELVERVRVATENAAETTENSVERQIASQEELTEKLEEQEQRRRDAFFKDIEEAEIKRIESNEKIIQEEIKRADEITAIEEFSAADRVRIANEAENEIIRGRQISADERRRIELRLLQQEKRINQERLQAGVTALNNLATLQNAKTKEIAAVGKAAAIASTVISTFQGAQAAFTALAPIPIVGPALGAAAAAAAVVAGLARVASIRGTPLQTGITEVPQGFPNDTFPARLSSGERVISAPQNQDLTQFLAEGGGLATRLDALIAVTAASDRRPVVNIGGEQLVDFLQDQVDSGRALNV